MNKSHLKENSIHGTALFPLHVYSKVRERDYHVGYHWHEELEFIFVEEGKMEVTINSELVELMNGQFIFINSGDLHEVASSGPSIHHAIVFHPQILNFDYPDKSQTSIISPITHGYFRFPPTNQMDGQLKKYIADRLTNIISVNKTESAISALSIKIMLLEIILELNQRKLFSEFPTSKKEKQENIKKIISYIQNHYFNKIFLEDLASLLDMNKNYFSKYFHEAVGKTPITYINEYRCEKAAELLKTSKLKILDISIMVGFDNFSYFIRKFKEHKRYSPKEYRKQFNNI